MGKTLKKFFGVISLGMILASCSSSTSSIFVSNNTSSSSESTSFNTNSSFSNESNTDSSTFSSNNSDNISSENTSSDTVIDDSRIVFPVTDDYTFDSDITKLGTYIEAFYAIFEDEDAENVHVKYKSSDNDVIYDLDHELIRQISANEVRIDVVGLPEGKYDFVIIKSNKKKLFVMNQIVTRADRSGYAFFKLQGGLGAYNQDGSLMDNATVVYVDENNKNTVEANGKVGITEILKSATSKNPICLRVLGRVTSDTMNANGEFEGLYEKINGIKVTPNSVTGDGTCFNQFDLENASNITIEGIGEDAEFYQWGISFNKCSSIEVKNMTFSDYPEDACAIYGDLNDPSKYTRFYFHNNCYNKGNNKLNDTPEHDKGDGDGATDVKGVSYVTYAYNVYNNTHKTFLVGGSDSDLTSNLTFHHNYYNSCYARLPLVRRANVHMYNNFFVNAKSSGIDARTNAYLFLENNLFMNCKSPIKTKGGAVVKAYNNSYVNNKNTNNAKNVEDREQYVSNSCIYGKDFDTNKDLFYYDDVNKVSDVYYLENYDTVQESVKNYSGPCKNNPFYKKDEDNNGNKNDGKQDLIVPDKGTKEVFTLDSIKDKDNYISSFNVGKFEVTAQEGKNVGVISSNNFVDIDPSITKELKLNGSGTVDYRSVKFKVLGKVSVKIYAKASSSGLARTMKVHNINNNDSFFINGISGAREINFELEKGEYFIASMNSGLNIAMIEIVY